jgi:hypothetical protein
MFVQRERLSRELATAFVCLILRGIGQQRIEAR